LVGTLDMVKAQERWGRQQVGYLGTLPMVACWGR